jgi:hypothetical protein
VYKERLAFHVQNPSRSTPAEYLRNRELELGQEVAGKVRVYLDTKFWILFRDHVLEREVHPDIGNLYKKLSELVSEGRLICPVSAYSIAEVQTQADENTRLATARVMDELSLSTSLHKEETRIPLEVREFLELPVGDTKSRFNLLHRVWTRPRWVGYPFDAGGDDSPPEHRLAARKAAVDAAWACTILDFISQATGALPMRAFAEEITPILNEDKTDRAERPERFKKIFLGQLMNPLEIYSPFIEGVLDQILEEETGITFGAADKDTAHSQGTVASTIWRAFKEERAGKHLPFFRILPWTLTTYVIDGDRQYKANDIDDFYHAAAALPYCHLFLTEKSMAHLLTSKPLEFNRLYTTRVAAKPADAIKALEELIG